MSVEDRAFFIAAGESLAQIEAWVASVKAGIKAAKAWADEIGAVEVCFDNSDGLRAMKFPGPAPAGWIKNRRQPDWHEPSGARTGEARAVRARAAALQPLRTPGELHVASPRSDTFRMQLWHPHIQMVGDKWIISQHRECKSVPADAIPIKGSEYMAMVEAEETATEKRRTA